MDSSLSTLCRYIILFVDKFIQTLPQSPPYHLLSQWHSLKSLLKSVPIPIESLHNQLSDMLGCERKASLDFLEKIMNPVSVMTPYINFDVSNEMLKAEIKGIKEESPRQTVGKSINKMSPMSGSTKKKTNLINDVTETTEILTKPTDFPQNPYFLKKRPTMLNDIQEKPVLGSRVAPGQQPKNYRSNTAYFITPQHRNFPNPFLPFHRDKQDNLNNNNSLNDESFKNINDDEIREDNNKTTRDYWEKESPIISKNNFGDGVGYMGFSIKVMKPIFEFDNQKLMEKIKVLKMQFIGHSDTLETIGQKSFEVLTPNDGTAKENFSEKICSQKTNVSPKNADILKKKSIFSKTPFWQKGKIAPGFEKNFMDYLGKKIVY